jgi:hypothetical protein
MNRQQAVGMYNFVQQKWNKSDIGFSYIHTFNDCCLFNEEELMNYIYKWKKCEKKGKIAFNCLEANKITRTYGGQTWYLCVVQPIDPATNEIISPICPLTALLFGFHVSGNVYAFKKQKMQELLFNFMNNAELKDDLQVSSLEEAKEIQKKWEEEKETEIRMRIKQAEAQLLADLEAEEIKKSSPKKKKEKKVKQAKVAVNPHKKEIRVSEGIWKPNPAWKKWEQENKRSASPP